MATERCFNAQSQAGAGVHPCLWVLLIPSLLVSVFAEAPGLLHAFSSPGKIYSLTFVSDDLLASGSTDNTIALWNLTSNRNAPQGQLEGHTAGVTSLVAPASCGTEVGTVSDVLISGSADHTARLWNIRTGELLKVLHHNKTVFGLAVRGSDCVGERPVSESSELTTACWDGHLRFFDIPSGILKAELDVQGGGLYSVSYNLDGSLLATASADRTVRIWDAWSKALLWTLRSHRDHVTTVDWSPTKPFMLASGGWDRRFYLWEIDGGEVEACRTRRNCSESISPVVSGRHPQLVWSVAFAPGGEHVAACHGAVGQSPTVVVYCLDTGKVCRRLGRHRDTPLVVAWSRGLKLASAGMEGRVLIYDGDASLDDMPQGDRDTPEEAVEWLEDLLDLHRNTSNASDPLPVVDSGLSHPLARQAFW